MDSTGPLLAMQCIVNYWKRPLGLSLLLIMVLLAIEVAVKRPLCINSSIVQRFDIIDSAGDRQSVYACSAYKNGGFSQLFFDHRNSIEKKVARVESLFMSMGINPRLSVIWSDDRKIRTLSEVQVMATSSSLAAKDFETDLVESGLRSHLQAANPKFERFLAQNLTDNFDEEDVFSDLWARAKSKLNWREALQVDLSLRRRIPELKGMKTQTMTESILLLLHSQDEALNKMREAVEGEFREFGLLPSHERYDLVLEVPEGDGIDKEKLVQVVKKFSDRRIVMKTGEFYFILPYWTPVPKVEATKLRADLRVVFLNSENQRVNLNSFIDRSEKVILFNADSKINSVILNDLIAGDVKKFLRTNSKFSFVQLHMPSFKHKMPGAAAQMNLFRLLRDKSDISSARLRFGWAKETWSNDVKAVQPIALYDAIQYYRIN